MQTRLPSSSKRLYYQQKPESSFHKRPPDICNYDWGEDSTFFIKKIFSDIDLNHTYNQDLTIHTVEYFLNTPPSRLYPESPSTFLRKNNIITPGDGHGNIKLFLHTAIYFHFLVVKSITKYNEFINLVCAKPHEIDFSKFESLFEDTFSKNSAYQGALLLNIGDLLAERMGCDLVMLGMLYLMGIKLKLNYEEPASNHGMESIRYYLQNKEKGIYEPYTINCIEAINQDAISSLKNMNIMLNKHPELRETYKKYMEEYLNHICFFKLTNAERYNLPVVVSHAPVFPSLFDAILDLSMVSQDKYNSLIKENLDLKTKIDIINSFFKEYVLKNIDIFEIYYPSYASQEYFNAHDFLVQDNKYIMMNFIRQERLELFMALWFPHYPSFHKTQHSSHSSSRFIFDWDRNPDFYLVHGHSQELSDIHIPDEVTTVNQDDLTELASLIKLINNTQLFLKNGSTYRMCRKNEYSIKYLDMNGDIFKLIRQKFLSHEIHRVVLDFFLELEFFAQKSCTLYNGVFQEKDKQNLLERMHKIYSANSPGSTLQKIHCNRSFGFWENTYSLDGEFGKDPLPKGTRRVGIFKGNERI